ncbi:hypothetical protein ACR9YC_04720 [Parasphingorhabdus sp. DH2-15]|uniref:hypothetical protein n=1 Tax=Parasphingorhabdus sp. DH2-15 TaxID=3444112 RepID=UPI003F685EA5
MPLFPKIDRHCPFKSELSIMMDGDHCTMCKRDVTDLTAMADDEKLAFLASCSGETCVRYEIPVARNIAAAAALGAATMGLSSQAAAQDTAPADSATYNGQVEESAIDEWEMVVWVGGIRHPDKAELTEIDPEQSDEKSESVSLAELPVVYEDSDEETVTQTSAAAQTDSDQPSQ